MPRESRWSEGTCAFSHCSGIKWLYLFLGQSPNSRLQILELRAWTRVGAEKSGGLLSEGRELRTALGHSGFLIHSSQKQNAPFQTRTSPKLLNWLLKFYHFCLSARQKNSSHLTVVGKEFDKNSHPFLAQKKCSWIPSFVVLLQSYFLKK